MQSVSPKELKSRLTDEDTDEILIDVREPGEYRGMRIPEAKNVPLTSIEAAADKLKDVGTVYVHCASGARSSQACAILEAAGVNVVNLEGGLSAWQEAGFTVTHTGKQVIPIIRQVMIAAGSLVIAGVLLGIFIHSWWYALPLFVGAGLLFAGVSGICMLANLLSYMPWNRH